MYLGRVAETGPTEAVWDRPEHPYSRALIGAVLRADGTGDLPEALPGDVPDPADPPPGCRFHTRCPEVFDRCRTEEPSLLHIGSGTADTQEARTAACWLHAS